MDVRGSKKGDLFRIAMVGSKKMEKDANGKKSEFYLATFRACNDTLSKAEIENGKGQTAPMLMYNKFTDSKTNQERISNWTAITTAQYDKIMEIANKGGDYPVFESEVFPKNGGMMPNTKTLRKPDMPYNHELDIANTTAARDIKAKSRADSENSLAMAQEMQAQATTAQMSNDQPSLG